VPKQPLKQMSLLSDEKLAALVTIDPDQKVTSYLDLLEEVAYIDNTGREPKIFSEDSEAYRQFTYTGRKKIDKQTLKEAFDGAHPGT
jgi:hypothetical protein